MPMGVGIVNSTEELELEKGLKRLIFKPQGDEDGTLFDTLAQVYIIRLSVCLFVCSDFSA